MQNPGKSKFNKMPQTEANRRVDETGVDKLELLSTHPVSTKVQETTHSASTKVIQPVTAAATCYHPRPGNTYQSRLQPVIAAGMCYHPEWHPPTFLSPTFMLPQNLVSTG